MDSSHDFVYDVGELAQNSRVVIYGTGELGHALRRRLAEERPDVTVVSFLDSFCEGEMGGIPIRTPAKFFQSPQQVDQQVDLYLVASHLWADEMIGVLKTHGAGPFAVSMIVAQDKHAYLFLEPGQYKEEEKQVERLLEEPEDRELWRIIVEALRSRNPLGLAQWYLKHPGTPYLHKVTLPPGGVVVEGGVFDGSNTVVFSRLIGPSGRCYGFDPWGEEFIRKSGRLSAEEENIDIIPQALWDKEARLYVHRHAAGAYVDENPEDSVSCIQGTTIDGFAARKALQRLDLIKMDIEGGEQRALAGAKRSIERYRPQLAVCIYHSVEDLFGIPLRLGRELSDYRFHLYGYSPALGDIVLYAIPREAS
jgi:FkbM family methyltransferase